MARRRVHGPYRHGNKWRIVLVGTDGGQVVESHDSEGEAREAKRRREAKIAEEGGITVTDAIDKYELHLRTNGRKSRSIETTIGRVRGMLTLHLGRPLTGVTEVDGLRCYAALRQRMATDTHRNVLSETRSFLGWCMGREQGWIKRNPLAGVKGVGKRKKGKPQLRIDECRKFAATALELADRGDMAGVIGLCALDFGARITEIVSRPVRDLDDGGTVLWIPDSKTENGRRVLEVPPALAPYLLRLAGDRPGGEPLFVGSRRGKQVTRYTAYDMVRRVCRVAGVPEVSPHGLRGTHVSIARERGATSHVVAAAVGHGSYDGVTRQHYVAPGVEEQVQQRAALKVLAGGRGGR